MLRAYVERSELADIAAKVEAGERLTREDGYRLARTKDILALGYLADLARRRQVGDVAYFINNYHINHTNICYAGCKFCAFARRRDEEGAYTLRIDEVEAEAEKARALGATEVHVIGGLNPHVPYEYYREVVRAIRRVHPDALIQAYDAVEVDFLARLARKSPQAVLEDLVADGLSALPGGGGEIFAERVHKALYPGKIGGRRYLEIHRIAHAMGLRSNCSILYGHIETPEERVDHMLALRDLQDETGGFLAFISFPYHPANTPLTEELLARGERVPPATTGVDDLRHLALARLLLDNIPHVRVFWMAVGMKMAQVSLAWGVDDLDGTVRKERIIHDAGADTAQEADVGEMVHLIRQAGRIPVERDTLYRHLREYGPVPAGEA